MNLMDVLTVVSFSIGIASFVSSLVISVYTIWLAYASEKTVRKLIEDTKSVFDAQLTQVKELLSEIDKRAAIIETTVTTSNQSMLKTIMDIIQETMPKRIDPSDQLGQDFMRSFIEDPVKASKAMKPIMELAKQMKG